MVAVHYFEGEYPHPIDTLERHFGDGGTTLARAAFECTFFVPPNRVRERTPYFPNFARKSRDHYPGLDVGESAIWQGRPVTLDGNHRAQAAWAKYSGRPIERGTGYGVRHIWGNPWDPVGFTAGWNLAYMPFWAGMLTEDQHPHPVLPEAIKQAAWNLFFREDPVCPPPEFVNNPGLDLDDLLDHQPLLLAAPRAPTGDAKRPASPATIDQLDTVAQIKALRRQSNSSWSNLAKAARALKGLPHEPFGTLNVEAKSKSDIRRLMRETSLDLTALAAIIDQLSPNSTPGPPRAADGL